MQATHVNAWRPQDSSTSETDDEEAEATETDETEEFAMEEDEKDLETADTGGEQWPFKPRLFAVYTWITLTIQLFFGSL